jgi:hypothetical protein
MLLEEVGFISVRCLGTTGVSTSEFTIGAQFCCLKPAAALREKPHA